MDSNIEEIKAELSKTHGKLYEISIGGKDYIYRPLTIGELALARKTDWDHAELEDYYVQNAVLYPSDFNINRMKAGYITAIADAILMHSGFQDLGTINHMLEERRLVAKTDIVHTMKSYILTAMPGYTEEYLDELSMQEFVSKTVLAEDIITINQQMAGFETSGFKLAITPVDDGEDVFSGEIESEQAPTPKQKPKVQAKAKPKKQTMSAEEHQQYKESLIRRIKQENRESGNQATQAMVDENQFENTDVEVLEKILGMASSQDPIAAKLQNALEGVEFKF